MVGVLSPELSLLKAQYSRSKVSSELTGEYFPIDSADSNVSIQVCDISATKDADFLQSPIPIKPNPGIIKTRGKGSNLFLTLPFARLFLSKLTYIVFNVFIQFYSYVLKPLI